MMATKIYTPANGFYVTRKPADPNWIGRLCVAKTDGWDDVVWIEVNDGGYGVMNPEATYLGRFLMIGDKSLVREIENALRNGNK